MITSIWQCMTMINNHQLRDCLVTTRVLFTSTSSSTLLRFLWSVLERTNERGLRTRTGTGIPWTSGPTIHSSHLAGNINNILLVVVVCPSPAPSLHHNHHPRSIMVVCWEKANPSQLHCQSGTRQAKGIVRFFANFIRGRPQSTSTGQRMRGETATEMFVSHSRRSSPPNEENGWETSLLPHSTIKIVITVIYYVQD